LASLASTVVLDEDASQNSMPTIYHKMAVSCCNSVAMHVSCNCEKQARSSSTAQMLIIGAIPMSMLTLPQQKQGID